ncbi:MAG TPA: hypothetical protein DGP39_06670 [Verrucomicrobiales bacterium]|nr:hypothetical protein [Verrucomicrobiales bacterium]
MPLQVGAMAGALSRAKAGKSRTVVSNVMVSLVMAQSNSIPIRIQLGGMALLYSCVQRTIHWISLPANGQFKHAH